MKSFLRIFLFAIIMVACCGTMYAQSDKKQRLTREQLAEVQAKHMAEEMAMDDATRNKFVETYCQYQKEIWAIGPRVRKQDRSGSSETTDAEARKAIEDRFVHSQKILSIRRKYYDKYSKFLTQKQIERVYELERQIMKRLAKHKSNANRNRR